MAAPFEDDNFYIATFNFDRKQSGDKIDFYQGTCLIDKTKNKLNPLTVEKVVGTDSPDFGNRPEQTGQSPA